MKKLIAIFTFVFGLGIVFAQPTGDRYMFTGKLIAAPTSNVDCSTEQKAAVYEFEIVMLSDESYSEQNVAIVVSCPAALGANFFKVGATYKMEVFSDNSTQYDIVNANILDNYNLTHNYWAGDIKRLQ